MIDTYTMISFLFVVCAPAVRTVITFSACALIVRNYSTRAAIWRRCLELTNMFLICYFTVLFICKVHNCIAVILAFITDWVWVVVVYTLIMFLLTRVSFHHLWCVTLWIIGSILFPACSDGCTHSWWVQVMLVFPALEEAQQTQKEDEDQSTNDQWHH